MPGQWGNVALAAHRNTFFRPLRNIRLGDMIVVKIADASLTCFPFDYPGVAPQRFIVRARELRASTDQGSVLAASSVAQR